MSSQNNFDNKNRMAQQAFMEGRKSSVDGNSNKSATNEDFATNLHWLIDNHKGRVVAALNRSNISANAKLSDIQVTELLEKGYADKNIKLAENIAALMREYF